MKIHITNLYNFNKDDQLVQRQHKFADAGRSLGFFEMGIFAYPVETDTASELSKRLDGVIAALEPEDVVIMQLPTENGYEYEQLLFNKIKAYRDTKIALMFHDMSMFSDAVSHAQQENYMSLCKKSDIVIVPSNTEFARFQKEGILELMSLEEVQLAEDIITACNVETKTIDGINCNGYKSLCESGFYINKFLMDVVNKLFESQAHIENSVCINKEDMIHIGFGLHDKTGNYSVWVGAAMQSIIEHTSSKICFHILIDDTVSEENKERLMQVAKQGKHKLYFHLIDKTVFESCASQTGYFTIGTMFRIMLPELLPDVSKIIYLDADILVNRDIKELWNTDITAFCIAAVPDMITTKRISLPLPVIRNEVLAEHYINAGVLYMNLDCIREKGNMRCEILDYLENDQETQLTDQEAINVVYKDSIFLLDESWNYFTRFVYENKEQNLENKVYHFVGTRCKLYSLMPVDYLYYETISHTPWGESVCRNLLKSSLERMNDRICQMENIISQISGCSKKYIFYGEETAAMKNMYKLLGVRDFDYRVLETPISRENDILPCKDLSVLYEEKEFIVFVLPQADGGSSINRLEQMGLAKERDFFIIPRILSPDKGGYI